ncbi:hypothetical protein [Nitrosococcus watsonii]|uniref:Uncharacterized protein n=1 Tax=Nitrosococcus watsoni (strain C-113) TaxID=105559 RepID=D8K6C1_NITWC|nr:hypothetical protein [Nitrosococcus watsonii]ADJ28448.1 hypothetical protein Nwat_1547 [Nitrosococcus watsonii C-113]
MTSQHKTLSAKVGRTVTSTPAEHVLNLLKSGLATTPFCGGIASLMSDYIPSAKQRRLEEFTIKLAEDLSELQDRVKESQILTDEFAFLFEKSFRGAAENYQTEKLEAFRAILVNAALGIDLSEEEKEYFLNLVNTLSALHIRILRFMAEPKSYLEANKIPPKDIRGGFTQFFPVAVPGIELEVIKSAFSDLYQYDLINTDKIIFSTMTSGQGLDLLGDRISNLGRRFINFCTKPKL